MKYTVLSAFFCLFFTLPLFAQWRLAPVAGINISKIRHTSSTLEGVSHFNTNGFLGGLNLKYTFNNRCNAQWEGAFSQKGFETKSDNNPDRFQLRLNYLDFTLLGEYSINDLIAVNLGGNFGLKIGDNLSNKNWQKVDIYNRKDIGLTGGLKFYIGQLFFRTSYQHGLNALEKYYETNENGEFLRNGKHFNQTFQVAVGYYLREPHPLSNQSASGYTGYKK